LRPGSSSMPRPESPAQTAERTAALFSPMPPEKLRTSRPPRRRGPRVVADD
jgi:hypothetical protein